MVYIFINGDFDIMETGGQFFILNFVCNLWDLYMETCQAAFLVFIAF